MPTQREWAERLPRARMAGGELKSACPACGGDDRFRVLENGAFFCRQCCQDGRDPAAIRAILDAAGFGSGPSVADTSRYGRAPPKPETMNGHDAGGKSVVVLESKYLNTRGETLTVKRWEPAFPKDIEAARKKGKPAPNKSITRDPAGLKGKWHVLHHVEIHAAIERGEDVILVEGERACERLRALGYNATTWPGGTGGINQVEWSDLVGVVMSSNIVLWPDADSSGRRAMSMIAGRIDGASFRLVDTKGKAEGYDAADAKDDECRHLIKDAKAWKPPAKLRAESKPAEVSGELESLYSSVIKVIEAYGYELRLNVRRMAPETRKAGGSWERVDDFKMSNVREWAEEKFGYTDGRGVWKRLKWSEASWSVGLNAALYRRPEDPFETHLNNLPLWDETPRLDKWLSDVFDADESDPDLVRWASRCVPLLAVWRTFSPGYSHKETPLLMGPPNCGKSTAFRKLLPPDEPTWFNDQLPLDNRNAGRRIEAMAGAVIVELAELSGMNKADIADLKVFLTATADKYRLAYHRHESEWPRRIAFVATANPDAESLPDDDAISARFVAISVNPRMDYDQMTEYMDRNRDQIWAEALHRYREGERPHLPPDLNERREVANAPYRNIDDLVTEGIETYLAQSPELETEGVEAAKLAEFLGLEPKNKRDQMRCAGGLKKAGFTRGRATVDGKQAWRFFRARSPEEKISP
ncbi:MAG: hypothetical protein OXD36_01990 [Rhodobacter sp.]|nr:hypothetical protein [Rhodobacter sp.]